MHAIAARWRDTTGRMDVQGDCSPDRPRSDILIEYALGQMEKFSSPRAVALMRMTVSECLRDRDFALQIYDDMHLPMIELMADRFRQWADEGSMRVDDPQEAAHLFMSIIIGDSVVGKLSGLDERVMSETQLRWRLQPFLTYFQIR